MDRENPIEISKEKQLARVWLAAHWEKKLNKAAWLAADIKSSAQLATAHPIRHSSLLLLGIAKIYSKKARYLFDDCNDILVRIKTSFKVDFNTEVPVLNLVAKISEYDIMQPNPDADCIFETATVSQPLQEHEITMANVSFEYNNSNEDLIGQNVDGTGWDLDLNDGLEKWDEFDQSVEVARDLKENSLDILGENSVEFARDAQRVSFSPVRESFASIKDMEMDNENPVDFSFEKNDMFEFPINEPIEQMEQIDQMEIDQPEEINLPAGNKTVRKRSHKQKKVIVDSSIQISAAEWKRGLLDTSSLLAPDPYYPKTRFLQQLSEIGFKCIHKTVPKRFARLLETDDKYHPRRVALRALINRNAEIYNENVHENIQQDNQDHFIQDEFLQDQNQDYNQDNDILDTSFGVQPVNILQDVTFDDNVSFNLDESVIVAAKSLKRRASPMETPSSSKRIIDEISTRFVDLVGAAFQVEEKVGLDKVMTGMNRSEAARFFFEVLDRKTRDFIEVEQVGDEIFIQKGSEW